MNNILTTSMQGTNIVASLTESHFSSLPGSYRSLYLINRSNIDHEGVETNEAGMYMLPVCLVYMEHGFTFINIMCIYTLAQSLLGVRAERKQGILINFTEDNAELLKKGKTWSLKP